MACNSSVPSKIDSKQSSDQSSGSITSTRGKDYNPDTLNIFHKHQSFYLSHQYNVFFICTNIITKLFLFNNLKQIKQNDGWTNYNSNQSSNLEILIGTTSKKKVNISSSIT